jgi:hypothetical protein
VGERTNGIGSGNGIVAVAWIWLGLSLESGEIRKPSVNSWHLGLLSTTHPLTPPVILKSEERKSGDQPDFFI